MKKSYLLSLIIALCFTIQCWAQFNPESGKMYALKEKTSGLYLDIQTLGIHEPGHTTNSLSLNVNPCIIYFEADNTTGPWKLKNINGTYAGNYTSESDRTWNTKISNEPYDWIIAEETGGLTIAKDSDNFIGWDNDDAITAGSALYNNAQGDNKGASKIYFELVEYSYSALKLNGVHGYYTLRLDNFYMNFTVSGDTKASLQESPTYLYVLPSANHNYLTFQDTVKADPTRYLGHPVGGWATEYNCKVWKISEAENDGLVLISRHEKDIYTSPGYDFGTDMDVTLGRGLYTNVNGAKKWSFEGIFDYSTPGEIENGKYKFTSDTIYYYNPCNTLRFTLTESDAKYNNGKKRMSFDSFELFDADGNKIELQASYFKGNYNKTYAGMLDGVNAGTNGAGCCCGVWNSPDEGDDYFEILLPKDVDLGGAFSFKFVTENTTMNAEAFKIETLYLKKDYAITITNPSGKTATVTYDGKQITNGGILTIVGDIDIDLFSATEISGYTWSVKVDDEKLTITLVYKEAPIVENPDPVVALINRIGGTGIADKFKFVLDPSINSKQETFVFGSEGNKILIKGSTISAITTGLGWYLNNIAKINIAWNSLNEKTVSGAAYADLSNLPIPTTEETHTSDAKYRYYLNYCTFGYSMTSWTWKRWQQEIDWMALHGINMPLQIVGLEEVWRKFLRLPQYNYTAEEAKAFVPGPAYTAWWGMNNLQGWGGTGAGDKIQTAYDGTICEGTGGVQDDAWYVRQEKLAKQILEAQRALGMQPVLPGFSGMVPSNFTTKTGIATDQNGVEWQSFLRPSILDPTAQKFADVAKDYYTCLKEVMGESEYYSMDPFHEGGEIASGKYSEAYTAIYEAMEAANAGSQWVIQQWHWTENQAKSVNAVPAGRLIVLDLFSDGDPDFDDYGNGYAPQDAVFCAIPNFGGRSGLMGRLQNVTDNYFTYKAKYKTIKGIGAAPEAIEQTPVTYDLIYQLPWMNGLKPDVAVWVDNYAVARYGVDNDVTKEAWSLLRQGPLNYGADAIEGPVEDVWGARPNLNSNAASFWGKTLNTAGTTYTKERRQMLIDAVYKLLSQKDAIGASDVFQSNYNYDLVEFGGGVMADYAYDLLLGIRDAKNANNTALYEARRDAFLALIEDVDAFKGTNLNFRLGKWTQEARAAAAEVENAKSATPDWYEFNNARSLISTWTYKQHGLNDYSYRSWQGLMKDYYLPRWRYYFDNNCTDPASGYFFFEWNWAHGMTHQVGDSQKSTTRLSEGATGYSYTREPVGNTVDEAQEMLAKYILPVTADGFTYYAYRHLNNDLSDIVTVVANAGETIDLTPYFGALTGVESVAGNVVSGTTTDLSRVSINADAADGVHSVTITLNDKTTLVCSISINPRFNGIYTINYKNSDADASVFIAYNTKRDNSGNVGYKLIATSNAYSTQAEGDKHFLITPSGAGFKISAQGKYLKSPNLSAWNHLLFSDNPAEAGMYLFEEVETDVFNMRDPDTGSSKKYVNDYDDFIFGNDLESKGDLATFTFKSAKTFPFTMTPAGMATLCLPFNVKIPAGMYAYDFEATDISDSGETDVYKCVMKVLVRPGEVLKAGTPVIVKALEGDYKMEIVMQDHEAKTNLANSLLRGNFVSQTLTQSEDVKKFIFTRPLNSRVGFYRMQDEGGQIGANKCWMEWDVQTMPTNAKAFQITFEQTTDIEGVSTAKPSAPVIYDLAGRRLKAPQRGFNIVNGKKVIIQ